MAEMEDTQAPLVTPILESLPSLPLSSMSVVSPPAPSPSKTRATLLRSLKHLTRHIDETSAIKIESCIGFTQVPVGLAGPLTINGTSQSGTYHAPLATVEPTLVASCSRGCKAFQACGGMRAMGLKEGMLRAPVFGFRTVDETLAFYKALPEWETELREEAEKSSRFAKLTRVTPHVLGTQCHVKFEYACGDAAGQNMVTIATDRACRKLLERKGEEFGIVDFFIEGQMASDKKLSYATVQEPRGVQVVAWGVLTDSACQEVLKCSSERIHHGITTILEGGIRNGQVGHNINVSNITAAMFIALGQDAACVLESGFAQIRSQFDTTSRDLTLSLFIPSLTVGTVGGGTGYATQREALEMLNCYGEGRKWALAETIACFALALEVSTTAAIMSNTFTSSHQKLARSAKL